MERASHVLCCPARLTTYRKLMEPGSYADADYLEWLVGVVDVDE
jgi:hypothetical protein